MTLQQKYFSMHDTQMSLDRKSGTTAVLSNTICSIILKKSHLVELKQSKYDFATASSVHLPPKIKLIKKKQNKLFSKKKKKNI